jgi:hypothetical protein
MQNTKVVLSNYAGLAYHEYSSTMFQFDVRHSMKIWILYYNRVLVADTDKQISLLHLNVDCKDKSFDIETFGIIFKTVYFCNFKMGPIS